jgi:purine-cytosine permease-like protein
MKRYNIYYLCCVWLFCWADSVFAVSSRTPTLGGIANNLLDPLFGVISIVRAISITAGIGMILSSFSKFVDHRKNRTEITLGVVLTIFVSGVSLVIVGFIPFRGL